MKRGKAGDKNGIIAEMLKDASDQLLEEIQDVFNDIIPPGALPPQAWKETRLIVLFKKGDPMQACNYRPIAILPVLYKLFARLICERIMPILMKEQDVDQAAYRKAFSTDYHLLALALVTEKTSEWNLDLWLGLIDFEKAFDSVEHSAL